jgi:hypothetical protein
MGADMNHPSFGARGRHRTPLHVASSREIAGGSYPYRSALSGLKLPRTAQGRANRRDWLLCWVIGPILMALAGVVLVASNWR